MDSKKVKDLCFIVTEQPIKAFSLKAKLINMGQFNAIEYNTQGNEKITFRMVLVR